MLRAMMGSSEANLTTEIGERLALVRLALGLTQDEIGEQIGVAPNTWAGWEKGDGRRPNILRLIVLKRRHGISLDYVLTGDKAMLPGHIVEKIESMPPGAGKMGKKKRARRAAG
jgi:transcriptional regulator with XRE-family HTH domain